MKNLIRKNSNNEAPALKPVGAHGSDRYRRIHVKEDSGGLAIKICNVRKKNITRRKYAAPEGVPHGPAVGLDLVALLSKASNLSGARRSSAGSTTRATWWRWGSTKKALGLKARAHGRQRTVESE